MKIDLTRPFTVEDIAKLLASKDDSTHRQLRVSFSGQAYLSDIVGNDEIDGLAFRFETWDPGTGHIGLAAALDTDFVARIYKALRDNWPKPTSNYIEFF